MHARAYVCMLFFFFFFFFRVCISMYEVGKRTLMAGSLMTFSLLKTCLLTPAFFFNEFFIPYIIYLETTNKQTGLCPKSTLICTTLTKLVSRQIL